MTSYAYIHCKPDGVPFYVGKGALRRVKYFGERNLHHQNIIKKYGKENISYGMLECSNSEIAYNLEIGIIKCLKRMGVELVNRTSGGDGGKDPTPETRKKLSDAAKKRGVSAACHEARIKSKKGISLSNDLKKKISETMTGKIFTEEHRKNISLSAKKRGITVETRAKMIASRNKKFKRI